MSTQPWEQTAWSPCMISFARNEQRKKQEGNGPIDQRATGAMTYGAVELNIWPLN